MFTVGSSISKSCSLPVLHVPPKSWSKRRCDIRLLCIEYNIHDCTDLWLSEMQWFTNMHYEIVLASMFIQVVTFKKKDFCNYMNIWMLVSFADVLNCVLLLHPLQLFSVELHNSDSAELSRCLTWSYFGAQCLDL